MASYDDELTPESRAILAQILQGYAQRSTAQNVAGAAGAAASAGAQAAATNRGVKIEAAALEEQLRQSAQADRYSQLVAREREGRESAGAAYLNSVRASYMQNPNRPNSARHQPTRSPEQMAAAAAMQREAMARLEGGNPLPTPEQRDFKFDPKLLNPGTMEKIAGIAGPGLSLYSQVAQQLPSWLRLLSKNWIR